MCVCLVRFREKPAPCLLGTGGAEVGGDGWAGLHLEGNARSVIELLLGEYDCRRDDRGRLRLPAEIVNRHSEDDGHFVLRKGLDNCLVLHPMASWRSESTRVNNLDDLVENERRFKRMFFTTSKAVRLDGSSRIMLPGFLADRAGIDRDVVIIGVGAHYEIWDKEAHQRETGDLDQINALASDIFGSRNSAA